MKCQFILCLLIPGLLSCQAQQKNVMNDKLNPLLCDPQTGVCEMPVSAANTPEVKVKTEKKPVKIIYFTDPICSSCWGIEPQLRKLKLEYHDDVDIDYRMGGLLPDWSYNSGGISKPSDVAHHWDEVSAYYNMPIDGDVWLEDPLDSSYPPSIAFKAAQMQDPQKAVVFLRALRELLFLQKKNITKWTFVEQAALKAGLDANRLKVDYEGPAKALFQEDLNLARQMRVRGFPTLFIANEAGQTELFYGFKPYAVLEDMVKKVHTGATKTNYAKDWTTLFQQYPTLTKREFAELSEISLEQAEKTLNQLTQQQQLTVISSKNGNLWVKK